MPSNSSEKTGYQPGKLFIGGLSFDTTDDKLRTYFKKFGSVTDAVVMRDPTTRRSRGFGFVTFADSHAANAAMAAAEHVIDNRRVEAKRAVPREDNSRETTPVAQFVTRQTTSGTRSNATVPSSKKIFVGGLHYETGDDDLGKYFKTFGKIESVQVMYNRETNKSRGFGFVTFETETAVSKVLQDRMHTIDGKSVEVKRAVPKADAPPPRGTATASGSTYTAGGGSSSSGFQRPSRRGARSSQSSSSTSAAKTNSNRNSTRTRTTTSAPIVSKPAPPPRNAWSVPLHTSAWGRPPPDSRTTRPAVPKQTAPKPAMSKSSPVPATAAATTASAIVPSAAVPAVAVAVSHGGQRSQKPMIVSQSRHRYGVGPGSNGRPSRSIGSGKLLRPGDLCEGSGTASAKSGKTLSSGGSGNGSNGRVGGNSTGGRPERSRMPYAKRVASAAASSAEYNMNAMSGKANQAGAPQGRSGGVAGARGPGSRDSDGSSNISNRVSKNVVGSGNKSKMSFATTATAPTTSSSIASVGSVKACGNSNQHSSQPGSRAGSGVPQKVATAVGRIDSSGADGGSGSSDPLHGGSAGVSPSAGTSNGGHHNAGLSGAAPAVVSPTASVAFGGRSFGNERVHSVTDGPAAPQQQQQQHNKHESSNGNIGNCEAPTNGSTTIGGRTASEPLWYHSSHGVSNGMPMTAAHMDPHLAAAQQTHGRTMAPPQHVMQPSMMMPGHHHGNSVMGPQVARLGGAPLDMHHHLHQQSIDHIGATAAQMNSHMYISRPPPFGGSGGHPMAHPVHSLHHSQMMGGGHGHMNGPVTDSLARRIGSYSASYNEVPQTFSMFTSASGSGSAHHQRMHHGHDAGAAPGNGIGHHRMHHVGPQGMPQQPGGAIPYPSGNMGNGIMPPPLMGFVAHGQQGMSAADRYSHPMFHHGQHLGISNPQNGAHRGATGMHLSMPGNGGYPSDTRHHQPPSKQQMRARPQQRHQPIPQQHVMGVAEMSPKQQQGQQAALRQHNMSSRYQSFLGSGANRVRGNNAPVGSVDMTVQPRARFGSGLGIIGRPGGVMTSGDGGEGSGASSASPKGAGSAAKLEAAGASANKPTAEWDQQ